MGCEKEQKKKPQGSHSAREDTVTLCHLYFETATTATAMKVLKNCLFLISKAIAAKCLIFPSPNEAAL